jgi:hypothetical protein
VQLDETWRDGVRVVNRKHPAGQRNRGLRELDREN